MAVDLTKPIVVDDTTDNEGRALFQLLRVGDTEINVFDDGRDEAYARLFEAAPKMLSMLKKLSDGEVVSHFISAWEFDHRQNGETVGEYIATLIAEIEGEKA